MHNASDLRKLKITLKVQKALSSLVLVKASRRVASRRVASPAAQLGKANVPRAERTALCWHRVH